MSTFFFSYYGIKKRLRKYRHGTVPVLVYTGTWFLLGMHRILFLPDIRPAGYPAYPKAGYRISGRISG
jgi:hypothetical protein